MPGIDLVLPDFDYVRERADHVEAVVLTHGHEDHIGALPYLLRELADVPVYGTAFTLELLKGKLEEHEVTRPVRAARPRSPARARRVGPFTMRFLRVTHSIPDGMAVVVDTPHGAILHTGDFKIDQTPLDGRPTDLHGLAEEASGRGVHLLLSTPRTPRRPATPTASGASAPSCSASSRTRRRSSWSACFSSHIHRMQQVVNAARGERACRRVPRPVDAELGRPPPAASATCRSTTAT